MFFENRIVCEIMWKNIVEPEGPQIIRRMRIVCWISEFTDTHSEYVTLIVFPRQQWLRERVPVTFIVCTWSVSSQLSVVSGTNISVMQIFSRIWREGRTAQASKIWKFYLRRFGKEDQHKKLAAAQNSSVCNKMYIILDFKLSPCSECCMLSSGLFPGF